MKKLSITLATAISFSFLLTAQSLSLFINEVNYLASNPSQGIEIAGQAGQDVTGWYIVVYTASGAVSYAEYLSNAVIPGQQNGYGSIWYDVDQGSGGGGLALVNPNGQAVQFISYGVAGLIAAVEGPANGLVSEYIGTQPDPESSLELTGQGLSYLDFIWMLPGGSTAGKVNTNQVFGLPTTSGNQSRPTPGSGLQSGWAPAIDFKVYPNPTVDFARVKVVTDDPSIIGQIELFDAFGRLLKTADTASDSIIDLDLSDLQPGTYVLKVTHGETQIAKPVVKAKS